MSNPLARLVRPLLRWAAVGCVACAPAALTGPARGAIECVSETATHRLPFTGALSTLQSSPWSLYLWVRRTAAGSHTANIVEVPGALEVTVDPDGSVRATLRRAGGAPLIAASPPSALRVNEWTLVVVSFDGSAGRVDLFLRSVGGGSPASSSAPDPAFTTAGPATGDLTFGATASRPGMVGVYAATVLRAQRAAAVDADLIFANRRHHGALSMNTTASGGNLDGFSLLARWATNHGTATLPLNGLMTLPAGTYERASWPGAGVTRVNCLVIDRFGGFFNDVMVVRDVSATAGFTHVSPFDPPHGGFFAREIPVFDPALPQPTRHAAEAPRARRLATGPVGLLRVVTTGNSRSIYGNDGSGFSPGNFAHGFLGINPNLAAGFINRKPTIWFDPHWGFDCINGQAYWTGTVASVDSTDFARFWTSSGNGFGPGPGAALQLSPEAVYTLRFKPSGLAVATEPLVMEAYVLRYPGSSDLQWAPNKNDRQGGFGTDAGPLTPASLNTERFARVFSAAQGDAMLWFDRIVLAGDVTGSVFPGDMCVAEGGRVSVVRSLDFGVSAAGATTIVFETPFSQLIPSGATLRFGPWGYERVQHVWPGLDAGDPQRWRALRLRAAPGGLGVVVFGFSAWRPNVNGFVFGSAGWGGNGYTAQLERSPRRAVLEWMRLLSPDVWVQTLAAQSSPPEAHRLFTDVLREATPWADVVWAGEFEHSTGTQEAWQRFLLSGAPAANAPATTVVTHPETGSYLDHVADGLRSDGSHMSQRGNERLARLWTQEMLLVALPRALPGDVTRDGSVNFADLNLVLSNFGRSGQGTPGDADDDNDVDFADLNAVLSSFGQAR